MIKSEDAKILQMLKQVLSFEIISLCLGCAVAHLVEAMRCKPGSRGSQRFFNDLVFPAALRSWVRLSL
jgi:hypothetical protein